MPSMWEALSPIVPQKQNTAPSKTRPLLAHAFKPRICEAEVGGSLEATLVYIASSKLARDT